MHRRVISSGARLLARPLSPLSDPMTGFFALTRKAWLRGRRQVSPVGFKVGHLADLQCSNCDSSFLFFCYLLACESQLFPSR